MIPSTAMPKTHDWNGRLERASKALKSQRCRRCGVLAIDAGEFCVPVQQEGYEDAKRLRLQQAYEDAVKRHGGGPSAECTARLEELGHKEDGE